MSDRLNDELQPVSFGERLAASQNFSQLFRDGMKLVEETAAYLDGPGRQGIKLLDRATSLPTCVADHSPHAACLWLLLHRAVNEGEMSLAQANKERVKVKLPAEMRPEDAVAALPSSSTS
jgi:regulator of CtrA degradation